MDIYEKRKVVHDFCGDSGNCDCCPLNNESLLWSSSFTTVNCLDIDDSPEEDLDRAIEIIEKYKAEHADDCTTCKHLVGCECFSGGTCNRFEREDAVNSPKHYNDGKIEVIDFIEDKKLGFCLGNAIKYIARAGKKDPTKEVEDLKKAEWYIKRRIKEIEEASGE